jgi:hypothetical protein
VNTAGEVGLPFRSMSLIENERTKLTAAYLNGLAIAIFAIGGLAPFFSYIHDPNSETCMADRIGRERLHTDFRRPTFDCTQSLGALLE